ncbi:unnamed protein product [Colias eurytheme]|nr:unnamed protein product [Colias eurytheme]
MYTAVVDGWREISAACRGCSGRRHAAAAFGGHWGLRLAPCPLRPLAPLPARRPPAPGPSRSRLTPAHRSPNVSPAGGSDAPENACQFFPVCNRRLFVLIMTS